MAAENKIRIITRKSPLALAQTQEILDSFPDLPHKIIAVETLGDRNKQIPLSSEGVPDDFFTRELDDAVLRGRADVAVHSAKDLPAIIRPGLEVIALTKAGDSSDSLVSSDGRPLKKLKIGARVGACSESRKSQLLGIRPDLKVVSVRGAIEERLFLVESGRIDALIVATCALKRLGLASKITEILRFETHPLQGMLAVTAKKSRADMKVFFSKIDARRTWGKVYIIGAGPDGRDLLTVKAKNILKQADIIFYDDLIDNTLLGEYRCRKIYVGKRKGRHSSPQSRINEMLFAAAQKKQIVARLKGGDPFIFGRGGEELLYLRERHIDVEVVPGITAAQSAAASALVPLTMRGLSDKLSFLSGHNADGARAVAQKKQSETLVFYMAASRIKEVKNSLIKQGLDADTPVALVYKAGFADEKVTMTSIKGMAATEQKSPLTVIVGKTAGLCAPRNKVLFTGLDPYNCFVPGRLVHYPLIEIRPVSFDVNIKNYDGIVFTSRSAVRVFCLRYSISKKHKIISIGPQTSGELKNCGYKVDYESEFPDSDVLAGAWNDSAIKKLKLQKVLYPCSDLSDNGIHNLPAVEAKVVYKTVAKKQPRLNLKMFSGVVFSSSSTVAAFIKIYKTIPKHLVLFVYGRHTAARLAERGYVKNVQTVSPEQN